MARVRRRALIPLLLAAAALLGMIALNVYYAGSDVIVYMYHSVSEEPVNADDEELSVRPESFERQLRFFAESGRRTIFASELAGLEKGGKYLVLTFDDGYEDNYTEVFPLLKKYDCKATIFMITRLIGKEGYLSADQIREMTASGLVSVQSHTVSHEPLALGDKEFEDVDDEFRCSKIALQAITGQRVNAVSVPNGSYDSVVLDIAKGYYDVIFSGTSFKLYDYNTLDVPRIGIYRRHTLGEVKNLTNRRGTYMVMRMLQKLVGR